MATIFYPPGWQGPIAPNGEVVRVAGQPGAAPAAIAPLPSVAPPVAPTQPLPAPHLRPPPPPQLPPPPPPSTPQPVPAQLPPPVPVPVPAAAGDVRRSRHSGGRPSLAVPRGKPLVIAAGLLAASLVAIAVDQNSVAKKWRDNERIEATRNQTLTSQLTAANNSVTQLSAQMTSLQGDISHLKTRLSATANAKEKALDQATVFKVVAADAGQVSDALSGCVNDMRGLVSEIATSISSGTYDPYLQQNATVAGDACASAQNANSELQSELSGIGR